MVYAPIVSDDSSKDSFFISRENQRPTSTPTTPSISTATLCRVICFSAVSTNIVGIVSSHSIQSKVRDLSFLLAFLASIPSRIGLYTFRHSQMRFHRGYPCPAAGRLVDDERSTISAGYLYLVRLALVQSDAAVGSGGYGRVFAVLVCPC